ncbi:hypothetical protein MKW94_028660 [Papaver nudicaule]|uniref:BTB domain-containing protein n=1 Tax=Papaver nudicaule TaxID=74823 RepID=A0AA41VDZ7_PAPNU|nr:hypothetical protein [Papaver nudicaule]
MVCSICKTKPVSLYNRNGFDEEATDGSGVPICKTCYRKVCDIFHPADWGKTWLEETRDNGFLGGLAIAFKEGIHSDIQVKPGNGLPIPAHKFLLATRSEIFKTMLSSDACKVAPNDFISLPEFNQEELETFLEFLYRGNLDKEKFEKHFYSLTLAADKYVVPHLQKFCEQQIVKMLDSSNALKVLEISEVCSNETLKLAALKAILRYKQEIFTEHSFEEFSIQNPHLMVHIARAFLTVRT